MEILRVNHIRKEYGNGDARVVALDDISFSVHKGDFIAIMGPSGSGKSTLLHIIGGVDRPSSGSVSIEGTNLYTLKESALAVFRRRHIGLVYQFNNLIPVLNVEENITLPLLLDERKPDPFRLSELLSTLSVSDRSKHLPNQLSGGQQQRVSIGRALINNPAIVLADEPTGNLDSKSGNDVMNLISSLSERGHTVVLITHSPDVARRAERTVYVHDGKLYHSMEEVQACS